MKNNPITLFSTGLAIITDDRTDIEFVLQLLSQEINLAFGPTAG